MEFEYDYSTSKMLCRKLQLKMEFEFYLNIIFIYIYKSIIMANTYSKPTINYTDIVLNLLDECDVTFGHGAQRAHINFDCCRIILEFSYNEQLLNINNEFSKHFYFYEIYEDYEDY